MTRSEAFLQAIKALCECQDRFQELDERLTIVMREDISAQNLTEAEFEELSWILGQFLNPRGDVVKTVQAIYSESPLEAKASRVLRAYAHNEEQKLFEERQRAE